MIMLGYNIDIIENNNHSMPQQKTYFKRSLILCISLLLAVIVSGIFASRHVDVDTELLTNFVNMSGKTRMLSQRIAFSAISLKNAKSEISYQNHKNQLKKSIDNLQQIHLDLEKSISNRPDLKKQLDEYLKTQRNNSITHGDLVNTFVSTAINIEDYFSKNEIGFVTEPINEKILLIENLAQGEILRIFDDKTNIYNQYAVQDHKQRQKTKALLVVFFTLLIFVIVVVSFYPMQRQLKKSLSDLIQQKKDFEHERNRYDLASRGTANGVWDWDIQKNEFHWNDVLKEVLGLQRDEGHIYTVDFFQSLLHDDDREGFNKAIEAHIKNKKPFFYEGRLRHSNGHYVWLDFYGEALWDKNGRAHRMVGSIKDVTRRIEAEFQKNIFVQGIENSEIACAIIDLETKHYNFNYASPSFCKMTGYSFDKLSKSNMSIFSGPETSMDVLDKIDYAIIHHKELELRTQTYRSDGSSFWNNVTLKPIFISGNFSNNFIIIFNDLSEEIQLQKKEISRQRNESLGSLAGSVAHEINNLLMPMTMAKDILEDELKEDCDEFAREQLDTIVEYANTAKEIVQGILTFSRKETSDIHKLNLYEEIDNAINFIENLLSSKTKVQYEDYKGKTLNALANKTEIKQIITNMCKNAEHSFEGKNGTIEITVNSEKISSETRKKLDLVGGSYAIITITDNGSGISQENINKIFEPLFTTKDVGEGTGLGLSVVIGIVRSWGGNIDVDSVLGRGTTFKIYIPEYRDAEDFSDLVEIIESLEAGE